MNSEILITRIESKKKQKCRCTLRCTEFFKINGFDVYCKKKLEELAFDILNIVNGVQMERHTANGWTTKMENQIIRYIEQNGVQNGTYTKLGLMLNKSRAQVKNKVYDLERQGRLSFKRMEVRQKASKLATKKRMEMRNE